MLKNQNQRDVNHKIHPNPEIKQLNCTSGFVQVLLCTSKSFFFLSSNFIASGITFLDFSFLRGQFVFFQPCFAKLFECFFLAVTFPTSLFHHSLSPPFFMTSSRLGYHMPSEHHLINFCELQSYASIALKSLPRLIFWVACLG